MTPARHEDYYVVLTDHVFDKVRSIDMTLAEFEELLGGGTVIEESQVEDGIKELVLIIERTRLIASSAAGHGFLTLKSALQRSLSGSYTERRSGRRARLAEQDGRTALVLDVPVEVCPALRPGVADDARRQAPG